MRLDEIQIGMRVKVMDKPPKNRFEGPYWTPEMDRCVRRTMTVSAKTRSGYVLLAEDHEGWSWDARWLRPVDDMDYKSDDVADNSEIESLFA